MTFIWLENDSHEVCAILDNLIPSAQKSCLELKKPTWRKNFMSLGKVNFKKKKIFFHQGTKITKVTIPKAERETLLIKS